MRKNTFKWVKTDQEGERQMDVWIGDKNIEFFLHKNGCYYMEASTDIDYFMELADDWEDDMILSNMQEAMDSARKWIFKILRKYRNYKRMQLDDIQKVNIEIYEYLKKGDEVK